MFPRRSRLQRVSSSQGPSPPTLRPLIALDATPAWVPSVAFRVQPSAA